MARRVIHGGRVEISVNGKTIGRMTGFNPTQSFGLAPQYEIGSIYPYEHTALRFTGSFTCSGFLVEKQGLISAGIPVGETPETLKTAFRDLMTTNGVTVCLKDKRGNTLLTLLACKCDTHSVAVTANAVVMRNATFQFGSEGPMLMDELPESSDGYTMEVPEHSAGGG